VALRLPVTIHKIIIIRIRIKIIEIIIMIIIIMIIITMVIPDTRTETAYSTGVSNSSVTGVCEVARCTLSWTVFIFVCVVKISFS